MSKIVIDKSQFKTYMAYQNQLLFLEKFRSIRSCRDSVNNAINEIKKTIEALESGKSIPAMVKEGELSIEDAIRVWEKLKSKKDDLELPLDVPESSRTAKKQRRNSVVVSKIDILYWITEEFLDSIGFLRSDVNLQHEKEYVLTLPEPEKEKYKFYVAIHQQKDAGGIYFSVLLRRDTIENTGDDPYKRKYVAIPANKIPELRPENKDEESRNIVKIYKRLYADTSILWRYLKQGLKTPSVLSDSRSRSSNMSF